MGKIGRVIEAEHKYNSLVITTGNHNNLLKTKVGLQGGLETKTWLPFPGTINSDLFVVKVTTGSQFNP